MRHKARIGELERFEFARNPHYLASLRLGLRAALYWAPLSFWRTMKAPVLAFCTALFLIAGTLAVWIFTRCLVLVAGLLGYLSETVSKE